MWQRKMMIVVFSLCVAATCGTRDIVVDELPDVPSPDRDVGGPDAVEPDADACVRQCEGRECGDDGCGGECGPCDSEAEKCEQYRCIPRECPMSDQEYCDHVGRVCGSIEGTDPCGQYHEGLCENHCKEYESCSEAGACLCEGEPEEALCALAGVLYGAVCGQGTLADRCDESRDYDCGDPCEAEVERCNPATNQCDCVPETIEELCTDAGKNCGTYHARNRCGEVVRIEDCGAVTGHEPCPESELCINNVCSDPRAVPSNDECASAEDLFLIEEGLGSERLFVATVRTNNCRATGSAQSSCAHYSGGDVVYRVHLPEMGELSVSVTPVWGSLVRQETYLRNICDAADSELVCSNGQGDNTPYELTAPQVGGGEGAVVYLWADAWQASRCGVSDLRVTLRPTAERHANDHCADAVPLALHGSIDESGTLFSATPDLPASACRFVGPDIYYTLTPAADTAAAITVKTADERVAPFLTLLTDCDGGEYACAEGTEGAAWLGKGLLTGGTRYTLRVGALAPADFTLSIELLPVVTNDSCLDAHVPLDFTVSTVQQVGGDTRVASNNLTGSCHLLNDGGDLVYAISLPSGPTRNLHVTATPVDSTYQGAIYLRSSCADAGTELSGSCDHAPHVALPLTIDAFGLAPRSTYYLIVDTFGDRAGPFELTIEIPARGEAPYNDLCDAIEEPGSASLPYQLVVDPETRYLHVEGKTLDAGHERAPSVCDARGADVYYRIHTDEPVYASIAVVAKEHSRGFIPVVYVYEGGCDGAHLVGDRCEHAASPTEMVRLQHALSVPGDYTLVIDGAQGTEGEFDLHLYLHPIPVNTSCGTAAPIVLSDSSTMVLRGNTSASSNTETSSCADGDTGRELYWRLDLPEGEGFRDVAIDIPRLPGSAHVALASVRGSCQPYSEGNERACARAVDGDLSATAYKLGAGRSYFLLVDSGVEGADGPFEVWLSISESNVDETHDRCDPAAEWVHFDGALDDAVRVATIRGDTFQGVDDSVARCKPTTAGGDLVYRLSLPDARHYAFTLMPEAENPLLAPAVYVRDACDAPSDRACYTAEQGRAVTFQVRNVEGGEELFAFVDSSGYQTEGPFTLRVEAVKRGTPPLEDTCEGAALAGGRLLGAAPSTLVLREQSTADARNDYVGTCSSAATPHTGADLVYWIEVPDAAIFTARLHKSVNSPDYLPALYLRRAGGCLGADPGDEIACANAATGTFAIVSAYANPGDTFYVIVDGIESATGTSTYGDYALELSTVPAEVPIADACNTAEPVSDLELVQAKTLLGNTSLATNNGGSARLSLGDGPDVVYEIPVSLQVAHLKARLTFAQATGSAVLYLRGPSCVLADVSNELVASSANQGGPTALDVMLPHGVYYLWVDSVRPLAGEYMLDLELTPAPQDDTPLECGEALSATELSPQNPSVTFQGTTSWGVDRQQPTASCAPGNPGGPEAIYRISIPEPSSFGLRAKVAPAEGAMPLYAPIIYLRRECDAPASETVCSPSGDVEIERAAGGDYFVIIDSVGPYGDAFQLAVELFHPKGDACETASPVALDENGYARIVGDTSKAEGNHDRQCGTPELMPGGEGGMQPARDYAVLIEVPEATGEGWTLAVNHVYPERSSFTASIDVQRIVSATDCTLFVPTSEPPPALAKCDRRMGGKAQVIWEDIPPGTYVIWFDSGYGRQDHIFYGDIDLVPTGSMLPTHPPPSAAPTSVPAGVRALCEAATVLDLSSGYALANGTTAGRTSTMHNSCNNWSGAEAAFQMRLAGPGTLIATLVPSPGSGMALNPEIRTVCGSQASALSCEMAGSAGQPVSIRTTISSELEETYYLWVDGSSPTAGGPFTVVASFVRDAAPETCEDAAELPPFDGKGLAVVSGLLWGEQSDELGDCNLPTGFVGPEHVYRLDLDAPATISATVIGSMTFYWTSTSQFDRPALYVRSGEECAGASPVADACVLGSNGNATIEELALGPGVYYLFVDTTNIYAVEATPLPYTLVVTKVLTPPPAENDSCDAPELPVIALDALGRGSLASATGIESGRDDMSGTCAAMGGPDLVYAVDAPAGRTLTVALTAEGTAFEGIYLPSLHLRASCDTDPESELACATASAVGASAVASVHLTSEQRVYIVVDAVAPEASGRFTIDVRALSPDRLAANDTCVEPFPESAVVSFTNSRASISGTLDDARHDTTGLCGASNGPEKVYRFHLDHPYGFKAIVDADFVPALYLRPVCGAHDLVYRLACHAPTGGRTASIEAPQLAGGADYYLWVDSNSAAAGGSFWVDLALESEVVVPIPGGCAGLQEIVLPVAGDYNEQAGRVFTKYDADTTTTGLCEALHGPDFTYSLRYPRDFDLSLYVTGAPAPFIYLRNSCESDLQENELACIDGRTTGSNALVVRKLVANQNYFVFVDYKDMAAVGSHKLYVKVVDHDTAKAPPPNDRCEGAIALQLDANPRQSGDNTNANADYSFGKSAAGGCTKSYERGRGAELVYRYTPTTTTPFKVSLKPNPYWDATLWVSTACDVTQCVAGVDGGSSSRPESVLVSNPIPNQTYYIFADAKDYSARGPFEIWVEEVP